ncbi:MAG: hypothetical protein D6705_13770 [Deltaproteobacteria bacterium]|nr:MAG: hypothetical protein D6705_13770 [Deltaproteobacteria bacterium]
MAAFFRGVETEPPEAVEAIAMVMRGPYIDATRAHVPGWQQKVCFERFHVATYLGDAVHEVRKEEHRALRAPATTVWRERGTCGRWARRSGPVRAESGRMRSTHSGRAT